MKSAIRNFLPKSILNKVDLLDEYNHIILKLLVTKSYASKTSYDKLKVKE